MSDSNKNKPQRPAGNAPRGSRRNQQPQQAQPSRVTNPIARPKRGSTSAAPRKYMNQQQREAMYQRWLYIGLAVAAGLIVLALGIGALWQYQYMPNQVLAEVNGEKITRRDYWKYQDITLYNEARMYENFAADFTGQQQSQFLMYATQLDNARKDIYGSTDVSETTLNQMIEDRLYVKTAEEQGVDMSQPVLMQHALNTFAPTDSPLVTPIPSPTMIPERAGWATETAEAMQTQQAEQAAMMGTPMASPVAEGTPAATPVAEASPDMAVVQASAESDYQNFVSTVLDDTDLTEEEYLELFAKPEVARAHFRAEAVNSVPQSAPQVEVRHIMVDTEERANQIHDDITSGTTTFEDAAATNSMDTMTSGNGGQLGWVTDGELPQELNDVVFNMEPGDLSAPVQSPYGWHILMVDGTDDDRALTQTQYDMAIQKAETTFLDEARASNEIKSDRYNPEPSPTAAQFMPPADAPTPIVATPVAAPDMSATPIAGPAMPSASPEASPQASPAASPEATP